MNVWYVAVAGWIAVIFFSSTTLASEWCEELFAWLSSILFGSLHTSESSYSVLHLLADKGLHVTLFLVLALLLWRAYSTKHAKVWLILATGLVVGSCSEFLQSFFPGRDPAVRDVFINFVGTSLGAMVAVTMSRWRAGRSRELIGSPAKQ